MILQEFTRDIVPILQLLIGLAGLISLFLLWGQIRQTNLWHKLQSSHNFIQLESMKLERLLIEQSAKIGVNLKGGRADPLSEAEVRQLLENSDCYFALLTFLNDVEGSCAAIAIGFADPDLSYANHSSRVIGTYRVYEPVILTLPGSCRHLVKTLRRRRCGSCGKRVAFSKDCGNRGAISTVCQLP